jgi:hypothetical protein
MRRLGLLLLLLCGCGTETTFMLVCPAGSSFDYPAGDHVASTACADPHPIRWPALPLSVEILFDTSDYDGSAMEAVSFWNDSLGRKAFTYATGSDISDVQFATGDATSGHLGRTHHTVEPSGRLTAQVFLDQPGDPCEVARVLEHEIGHVLGLAHDPDLDTSIMRSYIDNGVSAETDCYEHIFLVTPADRDAILGVYGR